MPNFLYILPDSVRVLFEKGTYFGNDSMYALPADDVRGIKEYLTPYDLRQDALITLLMTLAFLMLCYIFNRSGFYIKNQIKDFFSERERKNLFEESGNEFRHQSYLFFQTALLAGILLFGLILNNSFPEYSISREALLGLSILGSIAFYAIKLVVYEFVNWVFFSASKRQRWNKIYFLAYFIQGLAFFILICLCFYGSINPKEGLFCFISTLLFVKFLLFYKSYRIFFYDFRGLCYNILYLCTLEITPSLVLWKVLKEIS